MFKRSALDLPRLRSERVLRVSWLTGLLAGTRACEWPIWVLSRHDMPKEPETPEILQWRKAHDDLVRQRVTDLREQGFNVEDDTRWLQIHGRATHTPLSGRPDIAVEEAAQLVYEDCKTGRPSAEHHVQVMMYAFLARQMRVPQKLIAGNVVYPDGIEPVDMTQWREVAPRFRALMERVNAGEPARTPSWRDCRFCKVRRYCGDRVGDDPPPDAPPTE